jgi:hypothetical protein
MSWKLQLSEPVLKELYAWIDKIPLSKPRRKIERDFSDGNQMISIYLEKFLFC